MRSYDTIIIGAGPAGLFCAIHTAGAGRSVLLLEKKSSAGRKLLISGAGQCNITHEGNIKEFGPRYGDNGRFLKPALLNFSNQDLLDYFSEKKLKMLLNKHGKFFPDSLESKDVLDVLVTECRQKGARIQYREPVTGVSKDGGEFRIVTDKREYASRTILIATGGKSYPATGSSGDGYAFARAFGHTVVPPEPALTPIHIRDNPLEDLARIAFTDMTISLFRDNKKLKRMKGHLIFAKLGLSGPAVFNLSRYVEPGDVIKLSFIEPDEKESLRSRLLEQLRSAGNRTVKNLLGEYDIPERVVRRVLELTGIPLDMKGGALPKKERNRLIENLTGLPLPVRDLGDFDIAMVTKGGVDLSEVNPKTMASRLVEGLYFAGEVLDVDGDTGGYNIQAAFSTGKLAANGILKE